MNIELLKSYHVEEAAKLVLDNYMEERKAVNILPFYDSYIELFCKSIHELIENGFGVAAVQNGQLEGFLTGMSLNAFKGLNRGIYCPIYGHASIKEDKRNIYQRMYEKVSDIWVKNGCLTHAITMFAHDREAIDTWFWNGFGHRCVDAIRPLTSVETGMQSKYEVRRLTLDDVDAILPLFKEHSKYYSQSPLFMCVFKLAERKDIVDFLSMENHFMWAAYDGEQPVAFMQVMSGGETFVSDDAQMLNICGAYSLESTRGTGVGALLLSHIVCWLADNGYKRLGVDFESFNRYGSRFWMKHFEPFTFSLFRKIDERILWANAGRTEGVML